MLFAKKDCKKTSNSRFFLNSFGPNFSFPSSEARRIGCDWMLRVGCGRGVGTLFGMGR